MIVLSAANQDCDKYLSDSKVKVLDAQENSSDLTPIKNLRALLKESFAKKIVSQKYVG